MLDFVVCGRVADVSSDSEGAGEGSVIDGTGAGGDGVDDYEDDGSNDDEDEGSDNDEGEGFDDDEDEGFDDEEDDNDDDDDFTDDETQGRFAQQRGRVSFDALRGGNGLRAAGASAAAGNRRMSYNTREDINNARTYHSRSGARRRANRGPDVAHVGRPSATMSFRNLFERMGARDRDGAASTAEALAEAVSPPQSPLEGTGGAAAAAPATAAAREPSVTRAPSSQRRSSGSGTRMDPPESMRTFPPDPRGLRREGLDRGGRAGAAGAGMHEIETEDFDCRVVDQALELAMSRKVNHGFSPVCLLLMVRNGYLFIGETLLAG